MLARITTGLNNLRVWDLHFGTSNKDMSKSGGSDVLVLDLDMLRGISGPPPDETWQFLAEICGRSVTPMCRNLHDMVRTDFENVTRVLLALETPDEYDHSNTLGSMSVMEGFEANGDCIPDVMRIPKLLLQPRLLESDCHSSVLPSPHPSIPTIVVTPCEWNHEASSRVPIQDSVFGSRLTVPRYSVLNRDFPPMAPTLCATPVPSNWRWRDGHWQAVVPSLEEQAKRGLFSRRLVKRKRAWRARLKS